MFVGALLGSSAGGSVIEVGGTEDARLKAESFITPPRFRYHPDGNDNIVHALRH